MIEIAFTSHPGKVRLHNEDQFVINSLISNGKLTAPSGLKTPDLTMAAVIDGMGGHADGAYAALVAAREISTATDPESALHEANRAVYEAMDTPALYGMGAAAVAVAMIGSNWHIASVGDARAYYLADGYLTLVTTDHRNPAGELTQALGSNNAYTPVTPCAIDLPVKLGDRILLCSDGLTDLVAMNEIQTHLEQASLHDVVAGLLDAALIAGGLDNITVLLLSVE